MLSTLILLHKTIKHGSNINRYEIRCNYNKKKGNCASKRCPRTRFQLTVMIGRREIREGCRLELAHLRLDEGLRSSAVGEIFGRRERGAGDSKAAIDLAGIGRLGFGEEGMRSRS